MGEADARDGPGLGRRRGARPNGRRTKVITGRPDGAPRPLSLVPAERRRPPRTPAEWIGARPERIMAWAFALGLLLILIAISTADAATLRSAAGATCAAGAPEPPARLAGTAPPSYTYKV